MLAEIAARAAAGRVRITEKARCELERLDLGLDREDVCDLIAGLDRPEFSRRVESRSTGEWLYVFKVQVAGTRIYLKLVVRGDCIVISFHEDDE